MNTLSLGKVHLAHAKRRTYCGTDQHRNGIVKTSQIENRVTCSQCLHAYDVEMSNQQHNADSYAIVSAI